MQEAFQQILDSLNKWQPNHNISLESLQQAGSNRQYFRFNHVGSSYILTYNPNNIPENNAFIEFTRHFTEKSLPVPGIVYADDELRFYVQSDLGDVSLFEVMKREGFTENVKDLFKRTCSSLAKLQVLGGQDLDYSNCIATRSFDKQAIYSDLLYFLYYFVRALDLPYDKNLLLNDFDMLSSY